MEAIDVVNSVASGSLSTGTAIATGPAGTMLYVGLGALFITAVAGLVVGFIRMLKK